MTKILSDKQADAVYEAIHVMRMAGGQLHAVFQEENRLIFVNDGGGIYVEEYTDGVREEKYEDKDAFFDAYLMGKPYIA